MAAPHADGLGMTRLANDSSRPVHALTASGPATPSSGLAIRRHVPAAGLTAAPHNAGNRILPITPGWARWRSAPGIASKTMTAQPPGPARR